MDALIPALFPLLTAIVGYVIGRARDRGSAIHKKQVEAVAQLHERILDIEIELVDSKGIALMVPVSARPGQEHGLMKEEDADHLGKLSEFRDKLRDEERRARLWIDRQTVDLVSKYSLLMMHCKSWEQFGQGQLTDDSDFKYYSRVIFGKTGRVMSEAVKRHSETKEPWMINCVVLSHMCLETIQRRIHLEISSPFLFYLRSIWWRRMERRALELRNASEQIGGGAPNTLPPLVQLR